MSSIEQFEKLKSLYLSIPTLDYADSEETVDIRNFQTGDTEEELLEAQMKYCLRKFLGFRRERIDHQKIVDEKLFEAAIIINPTKYTGSLKESLLFRFKRDAKGGINDPFAPESSFGWVIQNGVDFFNFEKAPYFERLGFMHDSLLLEYTQVAGDVKGIRKKRRMKSIFPSLFYVNQELELPQLIVRVNNWPKQYHEKYDLELSLKEL